jgi:hypothetical protein
LVLLLAHRSLLNVLRISQLFVLNVIDAWIPLLGIELSRYLLDVGHNGLALGQTLAARGSRAVWLLAIIVVYTNLESRPAHLDVVVPILVEHKGLSYLD